LSLFDHPLENQKTGLPTKLLHIYIQREREREFERNGLVPFCVKTKNNCITHTASTQYPFCVKTENPSLKNLSILSYHLAIWSSCCRSFTTIGSIVGFWYLDWKFNQWHIWLFFSSTLSSYLTWLVPASSSNLRAETNGSYRKRMMISECKATL
jgi:hypothetical protein